MKIILCAVALMGQSNLACTHWSNLNQYSNRLVIPNGEQQRFQGAHYLEASWNCFVCVYMTVCTIKEFVPQATAAVIAEGVSGICYKECPCCAISVV